MKFDAVLEWVRLLFPAWTDLHAKCLAAMFGLLKAGATFEEMPATRIALAVQEFGAKNEEPIQVFHLRLYVTVEGRERCVEETIAMLVALGFGEALLELAALGRKRDETLTFHGVAITRRQDKKDNVVGDWRLLVSEVERVGLLADAIRS